MFIPNQGMPMTREHPQKPSFQLINQEDDKFFSKLLSKEIPDDSFSVGGDGLSGTVPFFWESQPGTPKHRLLEIITIPPLTPPPSHNFKSGYAKRSSSSSKKPLGSKLNLFRTLFLKARGQRTPDGDGTLVFPSVNDATLGDEFHDSLRFSSRRTLSLSDSSLNDGDHQIVNGLSSSTLERQAREMGQRWPKPPRPHTQN